MRAITNTTSKARFIHYKVAGVSKKVWVKAFETVIVDDIDTADQLNNKQSQVKNKLFEKQQTGYSPLKNLLLTKGGGFDRDVTYQPYWKGQIGFIQNAVTGEFSGYTFPRLGVGADPKTLYVKTADTVNKIGTKIYLYPHPETLYMEDDLLDYREYRIYNDAGNTVESISSTATTQISPSDMGIIINSNDPTSASLAATYASSWGIPAANIVTVALGSSDNLGSTSTLNTARNSIDSNMPDNVQWLALCFQKPSRVNDNSITWAISNGYSSISQNVDPLPYNPIFNWPGTRPYDIHGIRPSMLVWSASVVSNAVAAHGINPTGTCYMLASNDQSNAPRGNSRISQMQGLNGSAEYADQGISFSFTDNRAGSSGSNPANNILNKPDMMFYFNGMYQIYGMDTNTIQPGAIGDYVTSTAGNLPNGLGQTPITYLLENGFVGACGTVVEPWQNGLGHIANGYYVEGSGDLADQFSNINILVNNYLLGKSCIESYWKSLKQPPRTLVLGDPMVAPFCSTGATNSSGNTQIYVTGCTSPFALNFNPDAFIMGNNCAYPRYFWYMGDPLTTEGYLEPFTNGAGFWATTGITQNTVWKRGSLVLGTGSDEEPRTFMHCTGYNTTYPCYIPGVFGVDFYDLTFFATSGVYQWINSHLQLKAPSVSNPNDLGIYFVDGSYSEHLMDITLGQLMEGQTKIMFPYRVTLTSLVGRGNSGNNAAQMKFNGLGAIIDERQSILYPVEYYSE